MPTECSPMLFEFAPVGGRHVMAGLMGGRSRRTREGCCWERPTERSVWWVDLLPALPTIAPTDIDGRRLYEKVYCARGEMENRIKECQLNLFADRTSAATSGQPAPSVVRLDGYVLLCALRRIGLAHTQFADA